MMKAYIAPELEVELFDNADVIMASEEILDEDKDNFLDFGSL